MPQFLSRIGVVEELIAAGRRNRPGRKMTPTTVTIHNTDNTNPGAGAKAHSRFVRNTGHYILNGRQNWVSWHFSVDDTFILQHLPIDEIAFHAGSQANASSLAIEICMNPDSDETKANAQAAMLAAHLLARLGLGVGALRRHKDWTGKNCPSRLLPRWGAFVALVRAEMQRIAGSASLALSDEEALAETPVHAPPIAEDYQIDHEAVGAMMSGEGSAIALAQETDADPATMLRRVVDDLTSSAAADGARLLFPHGITEIALTLPAGISVTIKGPMQAAADTGAAAGDSEEPHDDDDSACEAPDDEEAGDTALADPIDRQLPASTTTFYAYGSASKRFGTANVVRAMESIAAAYFAETGVRLGIGNISVRGGGPMPPHLSHRRGVDVDIRVPRRDGSESAATWQSAAYSRDRTRKLVNIVRANPVMSVRTILFNDAQVAGVRSFSGHDNHLHVSFSGPRTAGTGLGDADARIGMAERSHAVPRSGGELDHALEDNGYARVVVALAPDGGVEAAAAAGASVSGATLSMDESFTACFEAPDASQGAGLAAAAVTYGSAAEALPPPPVMVYPHLRVASGFVRRDKIDALQRHSQTREVFLAPEFSLVRPFIETTASTPRSAEWGIRRLRVPLAWEAGFDGRGIVVGHLDTGIDASHPALAGAIHSFAEFDLAGWRIEGAQPYDSGRHGTHTAGTIAGRMIGNRGRFGVAPGCQLASALVIEGGDVVTRILGGLEWIVEQKAKVLGMSLGLRGYTAAFQEIIDALWRNDVLPVIAVGNEFANSSRSPGNYTNVLSVGAMGEDDGVASFSSSQRFNRAIEPLVPDLVAPGVDVVSCVPRNGYMKLSGSSMATPHIAGLAAILRQAAPSASAGEIETAILASCRRPASMAAARANRGAPDAVRALQHLGLDVGEPRRAVASKTGRRPKAAPEATV